MTDDELNKRMAEIEAARAFDNDSETSKSITTSPPTSPSARCDHSKIASPS